MSVKRRFNFLSQARVDVPHMKSIESATSNDFDELIAALTMGYDESYVVRGFKINMTGAIGSSASGLQMLVEDSAILHGKSNESGTFLLVAPGVSPETLNTVTNERIDGSFSPGTTNYVGIEFVRDVDDDTSSQIYLWNPGSKNETTKNVPLAITLDYNIVITTGGFGSNILPIATVQTDLSNNVLSVSDYRPLLNGLGRGGPSTPNLTYKYTYPNADEPNGVISSSSSISPFEGGDKDLTNDKDWKDAVMTRFLDILGTPYWTSENAAGTLSSIRADLANLIFTGRGQVSHSEVTAGLINWTEDISAIFVGGDLKYTLASNAATNDVILNDNDVAYITLVRDEAVTPNLIFTNGSSVVTSVGAVSWTTSLQTGDFIKVSEDDFTGYMEIDTVDSLSQVTLVEAYTGVDTGAAGTTAEYAYGIYETNPSPSTDRHIKIAQRDEVPFDQNNFWILLRQDNGGSVPRIYARFIGKELEQGESQDINDGTPQQVLDYVGMISEVDDTPNYSDALVSLETEVTTVTLPAAADITTGDSWHINAGANSAKYYVWYNKDAGGGDPAPANRLGIEVTVSTGDNQLVVAAATQSAIDAISDFGAVDNTDGTVTVTASLSGATDDAVNVNMGGAFAINIDTDGTGSPNYVVADDENLTQAAKRLDEAVGALQGALNTDNYEEFIEIVAGAPADDNEVTGPVALGTNITLPKNSRNSDIQESYIVGDADLHVYLNNIKLQEGSDYNEIGSVGAESVEIDFAFELVVGDVITFNKFEGTTSISSGGSGLNTATNLGAAQDGDVYKQTVGPEFQFRRIAAGTNMSISQDAEKIVFSSSAGVAPLNMLNVVGADQVLTSGEDGAIITNGGADRTITLPDATLVPGKRFYIKKIDSGNTLNVESVLNQTLDSVDITTTPYQITIQYDSIIIIAINGNWHIF